VRDRALRGEWREAARGKVEPEDVWDGFVARVLSFVDVALIRPLRVVVDAANGMAGAMLPPVLDRLDVEVVRCYFEPDGTFPNHEPNPLLPENREFIVRKTLEEGADLGVAAWRGGLMVAARATGQDEAGREQGGGSASQDHGDRWYSAGDDTERGTSEGEERRQWYSPGPRPTHDAPATSGRGTAARSFLVYSCRGLANTSSAVASSFAPARV